MFSHIKLNSVRAAAEKSSRTRLYRVRANLVRTIDPLRSGGADLQDEIMKCLRCRRIKWCGGNSWIKIADGLFSDEKTRCRKRIRLNLNDGGHLMNLTQSKKDSA